MVLLRVKNTTAVSKLRDGVRTAFCQTTYLDFDRVMNTPHQLVHVSVVGGTALDIGMITNKYF